MIEIQALSQNKSVPAAGAGETMNLAIAVTATPTGFALGKTHTKLDHDYLNSALTALGATGKALEINRVFLPSGQLILAVGIDPNMGNEGLRQAAGAVVRATNGATLYVDFPHQAIDEFAAIAEGIALGAYEFNQFRSPENFSPALPKTAFIFTNQATRLTKKSIARTEILTQAIHHTRDLVNTPPNHLTPAIFAATQGERARALGLKVSILNESQLLAKGFGGICGVGQGSINPPRLLQVSYEPENAEKLLAKGQLARIALVGKGITFDTGGLALKPAAGMDAMKSDMSGAAAVINVAIAAALLKLPVAIDAYAALAENMPSDTATRPSDVLRIYGGKTVEVLNPDAEGRLVLADAIVRAQEVAKKSGLTALIDVATLTGAQGIALGRRVSATMTNNHDLSLAFHEAAQDAGELFWPMPLPQELRPSLDSPVADLANIGERQGGMLVAGLFLREFVQEETPWLHLDIASPAFNEKAAFGYTPVGGTGVAVASLLTLLERL